MKHIAIYTVNHKITGLGESGFNSFEFYFLPMLRYQRHGDNFRIIQFRWLVWGINFRF